MALLTHPTQGSCAASSLRLKPWTKAVKAKPTLSFCRIGRIDRCNLPKNRLHLSIGSQPIVLSQRKPLRITAFKGGAHSDSDGDDDPNPSKASIRLSYASKVREDVIEASQDVSDILWRWLMMLRAPTFNQKSDCITQEVPARDEQPSTKKPISLQYKVGRLSKAMLVSFLSLDATIKFPVAVFVPLYLLIHTMYGAEVTKELIPLWLLGPLIVALYIKMIRGIFSLYVFTIKQVISLAKRLPSFCELAYIYVTQGKVKAYLGASFVQPLVYLKTMDYKETMKRKWKQFLEWALEIYLDFVESIWPFYCRTIRFLKRANLI